MKPPFRSDFPCSWLVLGRVMPFAFVLALQFSPFSFSQVRWAKAYGGRYGDVCYSVRQTWDGGYIAAGSTNSFGPGAPVHPNVYLIKTNAAGDTLWTKVYGGAYPDGGFSVQQTHDGGYVVAGYSDPNGSWLMDVFLIKTDSSGNTQWTKTYSDTNYEYGYSVQQTRDTGYIIAGYTDSRGAGGWDVYLIKNNPSGDTLWTRTFGGPLDDYGYSVQQTHDGGYIVAGRTESFGAGRGDVYLIRTNSGGDTVWTKTYGGSHGERGYSVRETRDGGFIVAGYHLDPDRVRSYGYLIKTDASGDTLWSKLYKPAASDSDAVCYSVQEIQGGYVLIGSTGYQSSQNVYLIRTDSSGVVLWSKTFPSGGFGTNIGSDVQQTQDGGYIIGGSTTFFGAGGDDFYLIKTDSLGHVGGENYSKLSDSKHLTFNILPNPMRGRGEIEFSLPAPGTALLSVYDALGRKIRVLLDEEVKAGSHRVHWDASDGRGHPLSSGVYFFRLQAGSFSDTKKIVVIR